MRVRLKASAVVLALLLAGQAAALAQGGDDGEAARKAATAQANESGRAFAEGDFEKLLDYTYPRVIELGGGRKKLLADLKAETGKMREDGFEFVSYEAGEAGELVQLADPKLTAVILPAVLKMRAGGRVFRQPSYLVGVSTDGGRRWTFISGSSLDAARLKLVLPEAGDRLKLPKVGELEIESQ
ncbi:MAG TPA: hypothetical protein VEY09_00785 [Pyrinomonadaceae bacterium]|nr:hypothetical protein [Pyrinomonadaceae bacterium]